MARPRIEIDNVVFEKLCGIQCTLEEIAAWFKCSPDTIERWCKREYFIGFAEAYKRFSASGKISLRRWQFQMAEHSVPMAIFLGKNWLGQTDRVEQTINEVEDLGALAEMLTDADNESD